MRLAGSRRDWDDMRHSSGREDLQARASPGELCITQHSTQRANSTSLLTTQLAAAVDAGLPFDIVLTNYTRAGAPFTNHLTLEPLCLGPSSPGTITHYVGTLRASPCCEALAYEPLDMDVQASVRRNGACDEGSRSLECRRLATDLLATNGFAPVTLPQMVRPSSLAALAALVHNTPA